MNTSDKISTEECYASKKKITPDGSRDMQKRIKILKVIASFSFKIYLQLKYDNNSTKDRKKVKEMKEFKTLSLPVSRKSTDFSNFR